MSCPNREFEGVLTVCLSLISSEEFVQRLFAFDKCGVRLLTFHFPALIYYQFAYFDRQCRKDGLLSIFDECISELTVDFSTSEVENAHAVFPPIPRPFRFFKARLYSVVWGWGQWKW